MQTSLPSQSPKVSKYFGNVRCQTRELKEKKKKIKKVLSTCNFNVQHFNSQQML